MNITLRAKSK